MTADPKQDWRTFAAPVVVPPSGAPPSRSAPRQSHPGARRAVPAALVVAVILAVVTTVLVGSRPGGITGLSFARPGIADQMPGSSTAIPPLHHVTAAVRQQPVVQPPAGSGGWTPMRGTVARPVRWDPCRPIRYVVSGHPLFSGGDRMLRDALVTVSRDTGLRFVFAGATGESAQTARPAYQPQRYGRQWAPVLVAWTDAVQVPQLAGDVIGLGGADAATIDGQTRLVSGTVYLDGPDLAHLMAAPYGPSQVQGAMLHELGHLVGLGHSSDPAAVMYPTDHPSAGYDASDLRGLATMGAGPCFATY